MSHGGGPNSRGTWDVTNKYGLILNFRRLDERITSKISGSRPEDDLRSASVLSWMIVSSALVALNPTIGAN